MVDHQGLERVVGSRKHRERKGFCIIPGWRYTKRDTNSNNYCSEREKVQAGTKLIARKIQNLLCLPRKYPIRNKIKMRF